MPQVPSLTAWAPAAWAVADDWRPVVAPFFASTTGRALGEFVAGRLEAGATVYPPQPLRALSLTALADVRVVILGQDPYHGPGQADGLAFSVAPGLKLPPSLRNILAEVARERAGPPLPADGALERWACQGVLLLNTTLTVEDGEPASHARRGWEALTDALIAAVAAQPRGVVFMLWGAHAQAKAHLIGPDGRHLLLLANHPSPLAARRPPRPFVGCGHFGLANGWLASRGAAPVRW